MQLSITPATYVCVKNYTLMYAVETRLSLDLLARESENEARDRLSQYRKFNAWRSKLKLLLVHRSKQTHSSKDQHITQTHIIMTRCN